MIPIANFRTARLHAERLCEDHLADLVALHLDAEVSRFLGGVRSAEATADYLAANMAHWRQHGFGLWVLRTESGAFAGRAGIRHVDLEGSDEIEIAYTFTRVLWGQGLATEIAGALTRIGLLQFALPSLVGIVAPDNRPSRRVLQKNGYALERHATFHGDDVAIYRIGRPQR